MAPYLRIHELFQTKPVDTEIEVRGWVRTRRDSKDFSFIEINDGSCLANLQIIGNRQLPNYETDILKLTTGCSLRARGKLAASPAKGQEFELLADEIAIYGWADPETYLLQKKRHSFEFLRTIAHLRPRTNSLGAVARIRSSLSFAIHDFFKRHNFFQIHTPIITTSDCEGAGEMFTVTTLNQDELARAGKSFSYENDFFGRRAGLTVSGQLEAEVYAMALGRVYTFGPTFRAENSNTSRHLAEFWMIEPEIAFCDLTEDIAVAEKLIKHLVRYMLNNCTEDLSLFSRFIDKELIGRLENVLEHDFIRISYTKAVERLLKSNARFEYPVTWGHDLQSEHERFLTEQIFKQPVVVTDYPKTIKPFYMRVNDDGRTVAAMDILFPGIGEVVGGSQREERYDILAARMEELAIPLDDYQWYLDLRRYGTVPHAGFGVGFERIVQFMTGMTNIRDVIPFPRTPGSATY